MIRASLKNRRERELRADLDKGTVLTRALDSYFQKHMHNRPYDDYIHPSSLNWKQSPDQQIRNMLNRKPTNAYVKRIFRLGDMIHDDIQAKLKAEFFDFCSIENHLQFNDLKFRGTPDLYGVHRELGNVIIELKSISRYQKDRKTGDKEFKKIYEAVENPEELFDKETWKQIYEKICTAPIALDKPKEEHLTQICSYDWLLQFKKMFVADWLCICYIEKETYQLTEFWISAKDSTCLKKKAGLNYIQVLKLLKEYTRNEE